MKIFVINLKARPDRLAFMSKQLEGLDWDVIEAIDGHKLTLSNINELGFKPYLNWKDPLLKRNHTFTDVAAMMSHYMAWQKCIELDEPILILEDDSLLVNPIDCSEIETLCESYDIVYLDHREMFSDYVVDKGKFVVPYYPYWNNAYVITPRLANKIIQSQYKNNLVPVDEFFPIISGVNFESTCLGEKQQFLHLQTIFADLKTSPIAYKQSVFKQMPRKILGSDIESGRIIMEQNVHVLTVATDESKLGYLNASAKKFNFEFVNLGKDVDWNGGTMQGPGGGQKLNLVKNYIATNVLELRDIILFVDGYDVFINDDIDTIVERFKGFDCGVLFAAEKNCWPEKQLAPFFEAPTDYKYLNSGVYIGYVSDICSLIENYIQDSEDDQLYLQKKYIVDKFEAKTRYKIDHENYIFQCLAGAQEDIVVQSNNQLVNKNTKCCPCILHGNGGESVKEAFDSLFVRLFGNPNESYEGIYFVEPNGYEMPSPDILEMDFMTPEACANLIAKAESVAKWESMYGDKFPAQELRIREIDIKLFEKLEKHLKDHINPLIEKHWFPLSMYGVRDAFIIKYSPQTQASLKCHHDASLVSFNVKLNDEYTGGDTFFYRQNYTNINTPVGKAVIWPGQVTHGHEGREVTSGTKYNLVIWTSRRPGDLNF